MAFSLPRIPVVVIAVSEKVPGTFFRPSQDPRVADRDGPLDLVALEAEERQHAQAHQACVGFLVNAAQDATSQRYTCSQQRRATQPEAVRAPHGRSGFRGGCGFVHGFHPQGERPLCAGKYTGAERETASERLIPQARGEPSPFIMGVNARLRFCALGLLICGSFFRLAGGMTYDGEVPCCLPWWCFRCRRIGDGSDVVDLPAM